MIHELKIEGFKRFKSHSFALRPMTILAGMNGTGKTSFIHALLLIREATRRGDGVVELNGPYGLELGGFEDVLNHETLGSFCVSLTKQEGQAYEWTFSQGETDLYASVSCSVSDCSQVFISGPRAFQYLCAERFGPRITLGSSALPPDLLEVGCQGEYCAQLLDILGKHVIADRRCCRIEGVETLPLLKAQAERWLSRVTRFVQIDTENFAGTPVTSVRLRTGEDWVKPTNMGFGFTYALPVILAGLSAGNGGLIIVENPEAHLHPAGQSQMGLFLATIAAAGVQVIVETHSDHILNGIRRGIGEYKLLAPEEAIVHYFDVEGDDILALEFNARGGISTWPRGFFDQYQLDVAALTRVRRPR